MFLTSKTKYAILSLLEIAKRPSIDEPTSLAFVAEKQALDLPYLEQIFVKLRKNGLVRTVRGCKGGYSLARAPRDIAVLEVVEAVQDKIKLTRCDGEGGCVDKNMPCHAHNLWMKLEQQIRKYLRSVTLSDVLNDGGAIMEQCDNSMLCGSGYGGAAALSGNSCTPFGL